MNVVFDVDRVTNTTTRCANFGGEPMMCGRPLRPYRRKRDRRMQLGGLGSTLLVLIVAGCSTPTAAPQSTPVAQPTTTFDGAYRSTIRVTGTARSAQGTSWCDSPGQPLITVATGQFSFAVPHPNVPGNPVLAFVVTIANDGTFASQLDQGSISGRVQGSHMEGSIDGEGCTYAFAADKA